MFQLECTFWNSVSGGIGYQSSSILETKRINQSVIQSVSKSKQRLAPQVLIS